MEKNRFIVNENYISNHHYTGNVWFIYDSLLNKKKDGEYTLKKQCENEVFILNDQWKNELDKTEWQRNTIYFCYIHYFYEETCGFKLNEITELHKDKRNKTIRELQNIRAKILFESLTNLIEDIGCGENILNYNKIIIDENILRHQLYLKELNEIKNDKDFYKAIIELQKWTKHIIENYNIYYPLFR